MYYSPTSDTEINLPTWAYYLLALTAAVIGIAASVVTAQFFIVGLERIEGDAPARHALVAAGVLMIVTELAAFFLAALLPARRLRALRVQLLTLAVLLVSFECATIYLTQRVLAHGADAQHSSLQTRIEQLQDSIKAQRMTATALRENGTMQSESRFNWIRQDGANTLNRATDMERQMAPLVAELAALQTQQRPTLADALGQSGMLAYSVARAVLVTVMGLVMCGAAGALLRAGRCAVAGVNTGSNATETVASPPCTPAVTVAPETGTWRSRAAVPLVGLAMATVAPTIMAAPAVTVPTAPKAPSAPVAQNVPPPPPAKDSQECDRYSKARAAVIDGSVKPSVRALQAAIGGSTLSVRAMQQRLFDEGVIERHGQGYRLRSQEQAQLVL
ncbi:MAG: hypothetical protein K2Q11_02620 [Burkholderiaceae bacterium]|nr:hypothetical protein [Burkholderiaceae bacterium]